MKLKSKQINDIEVIKYFIPSSVKYDEISEKDIVMFLEYSEKGLHKEFIDCRKRDGFNSLIQGKRWRGIHIHEMWEQGILDGTCPYITLLEDLPECVISYMKKEIFKGKDYKLIERLIEVKYGRY